MNIPGLLDTARALVAGDKGLLAMDESNPTCNKRFARLGIPPTEEARRAYRELIVTTPGLGECISGAILYDETIRQSRTNGTPFVRAIADAGIILGIKVDAGAKDMARNVSTTLRHLRLHLVNRTPGACGAGGLIQTASGGLGVRGGRWTNRSGWAANAASSAACRMARTSSARPKWTTAGVR